MQITADQLEKPRARLMHRAFFVALTMLFATAAHTQHGPEYLTQGPEPIQLDVPYVPTPNDAVHRMLELAEVTPDDYLIDLGSGDGRIVIQAARDWGVKRAFGIDLDPERVAEANKSAQEAGVDDRVHFKQGDLFEQDFSEASVLTMYLLESINLDLRPIILDTLRPGTRVVAHVFGMGDWKPDAVRTVRGLDISLWIVPAHVGGNWRVTTPDTSFTVSFAQTFQEVEGTATVGGHAVPMTFAELRGDEIRFSVDSRHFIATIDGDTMNPVSGPGTVEDWHAQRLN